MPPRMPIQLGARNARPATLRSSAYESTAFLFSLWRCGNVHASRAGTVFRKGERPRRSRPFTAQTEASLARSASHGLLEP
jgi:hypothetical protein